MAKENKEPDGKEERPVVVWGELGGALVFINRSEGDDMSAFWEALDSSKTVGDLRKRLPADHRVLEEICEDLNDYRSPMTEEMEAIFEEKEYLEIVDIPDSYPFDPKEFCSRHYDFRGAVGGFELNWFPDSEVRRRCADSGGSMTGGELETFRLGTEAEVVACLEAHGFEVFHDDEYVAQAVGW